MKRTKICTGKKLWIGTARNDDGFFAPGEEETWGDSVPSTSEYDAEVYAYIEEDYQYTVDGTPRDVIFVYGDCGLASVDFSQLFDATYDVYVPISAFKETDNVDASASHLRAVRDLGFNLTETTVDVKDGEQPDVTLDVPMFSVADALAAMGVKSVSMHSGKNPVVVGCETILSIDYEMTSAQAATLVLGGIEDGSGGSVSDLGVIVGDKVAS